MYRKYPFAIGKIYHVYNRGVAKSNIQKGENDCWRFMQGLVLFNDEKNTSSILWHLERNRGRLTMNVLKDHITKRNNERSFLVRVLAYCLMRNHYHLLLQETREGGITRFMHKFGTGYVRYFNNKHRRVGPLFQGRFKSILVDSERFLQHLLVYINVLNPIELMLRGREENSIRNIKKALKIAEEYKFSSHLDYLGKRGSLILDKKMPRKIFSTSQKYSDLARATLENKEYGEIEHLILG